MADPIIIRTPDAVLTVHTPTELHRVIQALNLHGVQHTVATPTPKEL